MATELGNNHSTERKNADEKRRERMINKAYEEALEFHSQCDPHLALSIGPSGEPDKAAFYLRRNPTLSQGETRLLKLFGTISVGTEGQGFRSRVAYADSGYMGVSIDPKTGKRYSETYGHRSSIVCRPGAPIDNTLPYPLVCELLPEDLDLLLATEASQMMPIAEQAATAADIATFGKYYYFQQQKEIESGQREQIQIGESLKGKNVFIIGASGVGRRAAVVAQSCGANVIVGDIKPQVLTKFSGSLGIETIDLMGLSPDEIESYFKEIWPEGADFAVGCTGRMGEYLTAGAALRHQGVFVNLSWPQPPKPQENEDIYNALHGPFHQKALNTIVGQINTRNLPQGITRSTLSKWAVRLLLNPTYAEFLKESYSHLVPMSEIQRVINAICNPERTEEEIGEYQLGSDPTMINPVVYPNNGLMDIMIPEFRRLNY